MNTLNLGKYTSTPKQDLIIAQRILKGEKTLFELFIRIHSQTLYGAIRCYLKDETEIEAVMITTYAMAFEKLEQFNGKGSFLQWLMRIGINEALKRKTKLADGQLHKTEFDSSAGSTVLEPFEKINTGIGRSTAHASEIDQLPPQQEIILVLREIEKMSKREIAACLGVTIDDVNYTLLNAHAVLKNKAVFRSEWNNVYKHVNKTRVIAFISERIGTSTFDSAPNEKRMAGVNPPGIMQLKQEHLHNLMLCTNIRMGFSKGVPLPRIKTYVDWYWQCHLQPHFKNEENHIFPILGMRNKLIQKAVAEHRRLERLFESKTDVLKTLSRIEETLEAHVRFEDRILFKEIGEKTGEKYRDTMETTDYDTHYTWSDEFWK